MRPRHPDDAMGAVCWALCSIGVLLGGLLAYLDCLK